MVEGLADRLGTLSRERTQVLPALHLLHDLAHHLPSDGLEEVAAWLHIPKSELYAIATSYTEFRLAPPAPETLRVCRGLSCVIAGSGALADALRAGGREVEECECLFACAVAPVATDQGRLVGRARTEALT